MSTVVASQNFTGSNSNPIGGNWITITGDNALQQLNNLLQPSGANSGAYYNAALSGNNCAIEITLGHSLPNGSFMYLRLLTSSSANSGYGLFFNGGAGLPAIEFYSISSGTYTAFGGAVNTPSNNVGDVLRFSIQGDGVTFSQLTASWNGTPILCIQLDPQAFSSGFAGIEMSGSNTQVSSMRILQEGDSRFVQLSHFGSDTPATTFTGNYNNAFTHGNLLVACLESNASYATVAPVISDPVNGNWNLAPNYYSSGYLQAIYWIVAKATANPTITATLLIADHCPITLLEYALPNATIDATPAAVAPTGTSGTLSIITNFPNELVIVHSHQSSANNPVAIALEGAYRGAPYSNEVKANDITIVSAGTSSLTFVPATAGTGIPTSLGMIINAVSFYAGSGKGSLLLLGT